MKPPLLYIAHNLHPAYQLRYGWTGWPSTGSFPALPAEPFLSRLSERWENEGLRLLEHDWKMDSISLIFSAKPEVSPVHLAARAKGRLQHALREAGKPIKFSRKVSVRSIGQSTRETVEEYIRTQLDREKMADPRYEAMLRSQSFSDRSVDLSKPTQTQSGRYWYDIHLVLVVSARHRLVWEKGLEDMPAVFRQIAIKEGYEISTLSIMPDHIHIALRGNIEQSPQDIALAFQNNLAYKMEQCRLWEYNYYVGTFGEYAMGVVRRSR